MNESLTSILVIFSEVGLLLALLAIGVTFMIMRRKHKDNVIARHVVESLRDCESARKAKLMDILQKVHEVDEEFAENSAKAMLACEKRIYNRVLKIFLGRERDGITDLQKDVENMAATYRKLIEKIKAARVVETERGDNPKRDAQLRIQVKQLEAENHKLQEDLDESMKSMESMLNEYTQMYSGGGARKEGLKHIENEMTQLKRKIAENLVEEVGDDDVPDLPTGTAPEQ